MKKIDTSKWKEFLIGDLFDIHPTNVFNLFRGSAAVECG